MASSQSKTMTDIVNVKQKKVTCDGESVAMGHPKVYLDMGVKTEISCPYCSRKFVLSQ